ncbi:MAG: sulfotransferase family 2 domain-containing protein [Pseudomonadota bacterium]
MVSVLLKDRNLLFLHVPKTGGGSVSRVLRTEPDAEIYPVTEMSVAEPCVSQLAKQLPKPFREYTTVAFVRNPWDWTVSGYLHVTQNLPAYHAPPSFHDFVLGDWTSATILRYPQKFKTAKAYVAYHTQITPWEHLKGSGQSVSIDRICRFENLAKDAADVFQTTVRLPHANKSERRHYSEYFDAETQSTVARRHADLIEKFGYQFDRQSLDSE